MYVYVAFNYNGRWEKLVVTLFRCLHTTVRAPSSTMCTQTSESVSIFRLHFSRALNIPPLYR